MKILVTGGAGFIGHHLILKLRSLNHEVETIDCVNDYYDQELKEKRLKRLDSSVKIHRVDITDVDTLKPIFEEGKFDVVCHLAAQAGVRYSLEHPEAYVQTNYVGTFNILENVRKYNVPHLLFASTSSVYGTSTDMPFKEDNPVTTPMSIYAATKRGGELLCANYNHLFGINTTCLRFFTVYGPWGRPDMALYLFTEKMLKGESINVYNDGKMKRDFTYIDDIVDGFVKAIAKPNGFKIFNLGNGKVVELMDFIKTLEVELGVKAKINYLPIQLGDVPETSADITEAKNILGFNPKIEVEEGISNFVKWYRDYYIEKIL